MNGKIYSIKKIDKNKGIKNKSGYYLPLIRKLKAKTQGVFKCVAGKSNPVTPSADMNLSSLIE